MNPIYVPSYVENKDGLLNHLLNDLDWLEVTSARKEYFMSNQTVPYTYGVGTAARTYTSKPYTTQINDLLVKLNNDYNCNYNVCFLNRYDNAKNALGWHSDDSPEMNTNHDIAVISFGAEREIWWKDKQFKGEIPKENRQLLGNGSLFIMPAHFQENHYHKIPRCDRECPVRVSLTFRNYIF